LRFSELVALADRLGLEWIATGHYARLVGDSGRLRRGRDAAKDQSYVLSRVPRALLRRTLFPVGELSKTDTRLLARQARLPVHDSPESQEICFIPDDDYRRFLRERLGDRPGAVVTPEGSVVGEHRGLYNFTVGQRRGLGLSGPRPYYVVALQAETEELVVGTAEAAETRRVWVSALVRHADVIPPAGIVQLRSSGGTSSAIVLEEGEELVLELSKPVRGVAPGQTAVLYEQDEVVAAGLIGRTAP
jgi:tRNA-specific 2-thiouridylase